MSKNYCRPLWKEGMFLAPQHMQQADNYRDQVGSLMNHAQLPYPWGVDALDVDNAALSNFQFVVHHLTALSPSGEPIFFPGNIEIPSRSFEGVMSDPQQRVLVYVGIPDIQLDGPNLMSDNSADDTVGRHRYQSMDMELSDENTGLSERMIQIRKIRGRILFDGEDLQGHQLLPIARIQPAPSMQGAILDKTYIPPLLRVGAWSSLEDSINNTASQLTALQSNLQRTMGSKGVIEWCNSARGIELMMKIQAVGQVIINMQQVGHSTDLTPFQAYNELLRTIGSFMPFKGDLALETPPLYNHTQIGETFTTSMEIIRQLCGILDTQGYIRRQFVQNHGRMEVDLDREWLLGDRKIYMCVQGAGRYNEVLKKMGAIKVCAPSHFVQVLQRRIQAVQFQWLRQPPSTLPATEGAVYAEIIQSGRFWPGVVTECALAVGSSEPFPYRLDLFVE